MLYTQCIYMYTCMYIYCVCVCVCVHSVVSGLTTEKKKQSEFRYQFHSAMLDIWSQLASTVKGE